MARSLLVILQRKVILSYTNKFVKHSQGKIIVQALWKLLDFFVYYLSLEKVELEE